MITRLKVQNYKSLQDVEIPLKPFTVFVGPNNAGKSNILDCLHFLQQLAVQGTPAVHSRGGFPYIVWGEAVAWVISIELNATIPIQDRERSSFTYHVYQQRPLTYQVEIAGGPYQYSITKELLLLEGKKILEFPDEQRMASVWNEEGVKIGSHGRGGPPQLYLHDFRDPTYYPVVGEFASFVIQWAFYNFVPSRMRMPNPARKELRLQREGENLSSVLHSYQSEYSQYFSQVESLLKTGVSEIQRLLTALTEQGQTYVSIEERGFSFRIPAWAMSDGTLRLLGQLAVISSPEPPPLACFEEPENCIHPHLLEQVVDVLKAASKKTQVLVTTHSPYLLNFLRSPENLIVVEKVEGKTRCKPVQDKEGVKEALKTLGLGELWYSGSIGGTP